MDIHASYERWLGQKLDDSDLFAELIEIKGNEQEIYERFYKDIEFGTGGLRGIIGVGINRMNIYTVRRATQGLANFVKSKFGEDSAIAIAYDSRNKSDLFARAAAEVIAANGLKAYIYSELMPTPSLSFAVRELGCKAGIVITASHNPGKYNGYKVYGDDGCQLTLEGSEAVLQEITCLDIFDDVNFIPFEQGIAASTIEIIAESVVESYIEAVLEQQINKGIIEQSGLKLVYTPLNGAGYRCVTTILDRIGIKDYTVVPEQKNPDGNFPTCPFPNPEIRETLKLGIELCDRVQADLLIATDPDADRVGIAVGHKGESVLLTGNQVGAIMLEYICESRIENGTMPKNPIAVKTIVTSKIIDAIGKFYDVEVVDVLTGFKFIGEQILLLEKKGEENRYILGFEESYGYLAGSYVRDKDAVFGAMMIVEMAAYYKSKGKTLVDVLNDLFERYGLYTEAVENFEFEGATGMEKMAKMMADLRTNTPTQFGDSRVTMVADYKISKRTTDNGDSVIYLPKSDVLEYKLANGCTVIIRPSGTEPKIKSYMSLVAKTQEEIATLKQSIGKDVRKVLGV